MIDLGQRIGGREFMDDLSLAGPDLDRALRELVVVNRRLGGYAAIRQMLAPLIGRWRGKRICMLDLGCGLADIPAYLVRWCAAQGVELCVTAVDGNSEVVRAAEKWLDEALAPALRPRIHVVEADVWDVPKSVGEHDVVMASLFVHHLEDEAVIRLLRQMAALARKGILVNDLHRHWMAYYGIQIAGSLLQASDTFRHDGPLSVRRGFLKDELVQAARAAGLEPFEVRWHWAFRWTLTTLR